MKVGIISDSHGNYKNIEEAVKWLVGVEKVELFIHLGDNYEDADFVEEISYLPVIRVPGVYCEQYFDPTIPNRIIEDFNGKKVLISHTSETHSNDLPDDLRPEEMIANKEIDFILFGHTHIPYLEENNGIILFNPGHLRNNDKRGYLPSFGLIDFANHYMKIIDLKSKSIIFEKYFSFD